MAIAQPKEGQIGGRDSVAISKPVSGDRLVLVHKLINYLLGSEYGYQIGVDSKDTTTSSAPRDKFTPAQLATLSIDYPGRIKTFIWPTTPENYGSIGSGFGTR